jgi:tRNA A37 threonylcarbamoyladenosine biosynthesis protein TsaE
MRAVLLSEKRTLWHLGPPIHHFDLYRLTKPAQLLRLDLAASFRTAVSLLEWAERLQEQTPPERLEIHLGILEKQAWPYTLHVYLVSLVS